MHESYFQFNNDTLFLAHNDLAHRPTLLFIHGIGDSHVDYLPYLSTELDRHYNILIPDLLGHGNSSAANDYSFHHQVQGIVHHLVYLQSKANLEFSNIILIAHSMGGIHGTLLCETPLKKAITHFINVEGSVTQYGSFIAENMIQSLSTEPFDKWFLNFKQKIFELSKENNFILPYYASLDFCQPEAFKQNATEMYQLCYALTGKYTHIIGKKYAELSIPRIYCYGDSLAKETVAFLNENHLSIQYFPAKTHFLLSECMEEFVRFVQFYLLNERKINA